MNNLGKQYNFKCTYKEGDMPCNGKHPFILDDTFLLYMPYYIIFRGGLTADKEAVLALMKEFELHVDNLLIENINSNGESLSHYMSVDINAEMLNSFINKKFGHYE
jgi:hypothetical protein